MPYNSKPVWSINLPFESTTATNGLAFEIESKEIKLLALTNTAIVLSLSCEETTGFEKEGKSSKAMVPAARDALSSA